MFSKLLPFGTLLAAPLLMCVGCVSAAPLTPAPAPLTSLPAAPIVLGYYSQWSEGLPPEKIRFDRFTHLIHAFAAVDTNGRITSDGGNPVPSAKLTKLAHAAGVKVLIGLGGGSNGKNFGAMARDEVKSAQFIRNVVQMVQQNGYDGADIDWEYPGENDTEVGKDDKAVLIRFVVQMRTALKAANPDFLLTMAVSRGNYYGKWVDGEQLKDKIDLLQIMTYDFHGPWNHAGHNAPLYASQLDPVDGFQSFQNSVDLWVGKGFSKDQLLIGVPSYGRGFATSKWGQKPTSKSPHEEVKFSEIDGLLRDGWVREWDKNAWVPWLRKPGVNELISYDDETSARAKGAWAKLAGVRGVFFWEISQDFVDGDNAITVATKAGWDAPNDLSPPLPTKLP